MPPAPPRRPRRWSWACTAVVVQVVGAFALAAMVAMPETHLDVCAVDAKNMIIIVADGPSLRAIDLPDPPLSPTTEDIDDPWRALSRAGVQGEENGPWTYRDAGLHVLLEGFREWLTE